MSKINLVIPTFQKDLTLLRFKSLMEQIELTINNIDTVVANNFTSVSNRATNIESNLTAVETNFTTHVTVYENFVHTYENFTNTFEIQPIDYTDSTGTPRQTTPREVAEKQDELMDVLDKVYNTDLGLR